MPSMRAGAGGFDASFGMGFFPAVGMKFRLSGIRFDIASRGMKGPQMDTN